MRGTRVYVSLTKGLENGFFLREKPLGGLASGIQLLWFRYCAAVFLPIVQKPLPMPCGSPVSCSIEAVMRGKNGHPQVAICLCCEDEPGTTRGAAVVSTYEVKMFRPVRRLVFTPADCRPRYGLTPAAEAKPVTCMGGIVLAAGGSANAESRALIAFE